MKLTRAEQDKLFETREKIDRLVKISHVIEYLERCMHRDDLAGEEGVRNILQTAVFRLPDRDVKEIVCFVYGKMEQEKSTLESELAGLKAELSVGNP